jgi:hypothetical protein
MRILKISGIALLLMIACGLLALWWGSRPPHRPPNLSASALYIERGVVPFKLLNSGEWLDCWFDEHEHVVRCKLTNMNGWSEFEDVFLPYPRQSPVLPADLILNRRRTGTLWSGTYEKSIQYPIVYLANGEILLPRSDFEKAKRAVDLW